MSFMIVKPEYIWDAIKNGSDRAPYDWENEIYLWCAQQIIEALREDFDKKVDVEILLEMKRTALVRFRDVDWIGRFMSALRCVSSASARSLQDFEDYQREALEFAIDHYTELILRFTLQEFDPEDDLELDIVAREFPEDTG